MTTLDPPGTMTRILIPFLHHFIAHWGPKWSPKCFQNRPFFDIFSASFFDHYLVPKWSQNGSQNRSKIDPKPHFLTSCFSTRFWSAFKDQKLVHCLFFCTVGPRKILQIMWVFTVWTRSGFFLEKLSRGRSLIVFCSKMAPKKLPKMVQNGPWRPLFWVSFFHLLFKLFLVSFWDHFGLQNGQKRHQNMVGKTIQKNMKKRSRSGVQCCASVHPAGPLKGTEQQTGSQQTARQQTGSQQTGRTYRD